MKQQLLFSKLVTPLILFLDLSFDGNGENGNELKLFSFVAYGFSRQGLRQAMHFTLDEKVVFV